MLNDDERNKNKVGVFNTKTNSYLINPCYDDIIHLKDGFIAHDYDLKTTVIYDCNGKGLVKTQQNQKPLLLSNNIIIFTSTDAKYCMIWNGNTGKLLCKKKFDSILFFVGSNTEPTDYSGKFDLKKLLSNNDFQKNGACFDTFICASYKEHWGVIDTKTGNIIQSFDAKKVLQQKGKDIVLEKDKKIIIIKQNGTKLTLY